MAHSKTGLLSPTELKDLYGVPILNDAERLAYFTFDQAELNILMNFKDVKDSVYFAVALVFFKLKHTFISFKYNNVVSEYKHVMHNYFFEQPIPKNMPTESTKKRIQLSISALCQVQRFSGEIVQTIKSELQEIATYAPRQRQLIKELLRLLQNIMLLFLVIQPYKTLSSVYGTTSKGVFCRRIPGIQPNGNALPF